MRQPFVEGVVETPAGPVPVVSGRLMLADRLGTWRMRWTLRRDDFLVDPGLYALGAPNADSPVLVTANYKMTFDVLRSAMAGRDAWVLVLDTRGINVWCAAGKGTFSTEELVRRLDFHRVAEVVSRRRVIVPQLGAVAVAAHEVARRARFAVVYGPVRAADLPAFLDAGMRATPEMREPTFTLAERLVLSPVEIVGAATWVLAAAALLGLPALLSLRPFSAATAAAAVLGNAAPVLLGLLGGAVLTPALLPWLPPKSFSAKGAIVGAVLGAAYALAAGRSAIGGAQTVLIVGAVSSFVAMNFTGSTPFTSMSGVEREMRRSMPWQAAAVAASLGLLVVRVVLR